MDGKTLKTARKKRMNYNPVEDTLILQGVQACGREWKSVLSFIRRHVEVLEYSSEEEKSPDEKEIDEICNSINDGENKYTLQAQKDDEVDEDAVEILQRVKRTRESERKEDSKRHRKKEKERKSSASTRDKKLDSVLDAIPGILQTAQLAAEEHRKTLKSWRVHQGLDSSSSDDDNVV
ncbi:hypothetical protein AC249_AIPGENE16640 [Exaiptasia diaphana]|nr:hypothetical protein AC249_AIPGENE16640 [Exaiptasia diaphana]